MIYLDTWVVGLQPNTNYQLQRAVDIVLDWQLYRHLMVNPGEGARSTIYCHKQLGLRSRRIVSQCGSNSSRLYVRYPF